MRKKTREQMLEQFFSELKDLVKGLFMLEERKLYLEEHPTKGNGYYTRDLLTLFGPIEDLKVPGCGKGTSTPNSSPTARGPPWISRKRCFCFTPRG